MSYYSLPMILHKFFSDPLLYKLLFNNIRNRQRVKDLKLKIQRLTNRRSPQQLRTPLEAMQSMPRATQQAKTVRSREVSAPLPLKRSGRERRSRRYVSSLPHITYSIISRYGSGGREARLRYLLRKKIFIMRQYHQLIKIKFTSKH